MLFLPEGVSRFDARSLIGKTIARKYRPYRILGEGGAGAVYVAMHVVTLRRVALKFIHHTTVSMRPISASRFLREAQASASIDHPAMVEILDAGHLADGSLYLVMELLQGFDLETAILARLISQAELVTAAIELLDALDAVHERGFIHRDVKPSNVFLATTKSGKREVKLLDFGIAKHLFDQGGKPTTEAGTVLGTPDYMSPEQAGGGYKVGAQTDVWSAGAILYRGLVGEPLFGGATPLAMILNIALERVPSIADKRPDLPATLLKAVQQALERDLEARWMSAAEMRDALRHCPLASLDSPLPEPVHSDADTFGDRGDLLEAETMSDCVDEPEEFVTPVVVTTKGSGASREDSSASSQDGSTPDPTRRTGRSLRR